MGSSDEDTLASSDEKPQQPDLHLDAFWIMRNEVTNAQYTKCVEAGVCREPTSKRWNDPAYAEHPVTFVYWDQANVYAQWAGGRLPTEAEWEKACRGIGGHIYPGGDDPPTGDLANFSGIVGDTMPVGSYPKGASPYGLLDVAGNVWEWTSSLYTPYPYDGKDGRESPDGVEPRTLRGGAWDYSVDGVRCAYRNGYDIVDRDRSVGFRVVSPGS
jgi:formylglycine-generating enzyme required for sulfatase activity